MPKPLTDVERRILDYVVGYLRSNTYQPSIREIGKQFNIKSTKTVSELLQSLAEKGWIERDPSRSRGVRLLGLEMQPRTVSVPWYHASPDHREGGGDESVLEAFELDRKLAGATGTFMLAMAGDSMVGEGIRSGDLLLVEPVRGEAMEDGDLVVARVAGDVIVRRFRVRDAGRVLEAGSRDLAPVPVGRSPSVEVLGRVTSVVRRLRVPPGGARHQGDDTGAASELP